ncbi:unnamed protein product [Vitrella brassicaformis CCMP3155]|uniref:Glucan endo-1,3-beta-D-glucosidase n=1 Tax=Vitrella brassicaformis (strain CCMP3155) TaxID=1169540 RepID=A0A0G4H4G6_VITBC|nr:unnamed protein product [Vitrella brassicaformis CCMP3155]|eukprot:CEM38412.1 unnamed protein product [Vitrella brassicaformis CCMP3155]
MTASHGWMLSLGVFVLPSLSVPVDVSSPFLGINYGDLMAKSIGEGCTQNITQTPDEQTRDGFLARLATDDAPACLTTSMALTVVKEEGFRHLKVFEEKLGLDESFFSPLDAGDLVLTRVSEVFRDADDAAHVWLQLPNGFLKHIRDNSSYAHDIIALIKEHDDIVDVVILGNEPFLFPEAAKDEFLPAYGVFKEAASQAQLDAHLTTVLANSVIQNTFPSIDAAEMVPSYLELLEPFLTDLRASSSPVMVNIFPWFAFSGAPVEVGLPYALGYRDPPIEVDGRNYTFIWDAQYDAVVTALDKAGFGDLPLVIGETSWPSDGDNPVYVNKTTAHIHYASVKKRVLMDIGTPKYPGRQIPVFYFIAFDRMNATSYGFPPVEQYLGLHSEEGVAKFDIGSVAEWGEGDEQVIPHMPNNSLAI